MCPLRLTKHCLRPELQNRSEDRSLCHRSEFKNHCFLPWVVNFARNDKIYLHTYIYIYTGCDFCRSVKAFYNCDNCPFSFAWLGAERADRLPNLPRPALYASSRLLKCQTNPILIGIKFQHINHHNNIKAKVPRPDRRLNRPLFMVFISPLRLNHFSSCTSPFFFFG